MEQDTVRRCQRCREPAVIIVNRWESRWRHSARTDHRCQSCGAGFSLRPWLLVWFVLGTLFGLQTGVMGATAIVGAFVALLVQGAPEAVVLLLMGTAGLGAGLISLVYLAGPQVRAWRNPIVPGAQMPELRLGPPKEYRVCTCGSAAPCVRVDATTVMRLPAGTEGTYVCQACGREFVVPDLWAVIVRTGGTLYLGAIALFLVSLLPFQDLGWDNLLCLGVLGLGALGGVLLVAHGIYRRIRHPLATG